MKTTFIPADAPASTFPTGDGVSVLVDFVDPQPERAMLSKATVTILRVKLLGECLKLLLMDCLE
jgi:hypothetical protein